MLDGYLTRQPNVDPALAAKMGPAIPTHGQMLGQMFLGRSGARAPGLDGRARSGQPIDPGLPLAFVAIDLLAIDDQPLLDIPLLERKRILETAFVGGRPPAPGRVRPAADRDLARELAGLRVPRARLQGRQQPLHAGPAEPRLGRRHHPDPLTVARHGSTPARPAAVRPGRGASGRAVVG